MAKSKSQAKREAIQNESKQSDKLDAVQCVEKITGESLDIKGNTGSRYMQVIKKALQAKGFDLVPLQTSEGENLTVIVVNGKHQFQTVVTDGEKITFDPSGEIDKKTKYQVVSRYKISAPKKEAVKDTTDSEE